MKYCMLYYCLCITDALIAFIIWPCVFHLNMKYHSNQFCMFWKHIKFLIVDNFFGKIA